LGKKTSQFMMFHEKSLKQYKKPIFSVRRPESTFISIEQSLDYIGDNSKYSKRMLSLFAFYWLWYGFFVLGIGLFVNKNIVFFCRTADDNIFYECAPELACSLPSN